jgi:hypothetical protein
MSSPYIFRRARFPLSLLVLALIAATLSSQRRHPHQWSDTDASRPPGLLPDPRLTPGAINPAVTQANIDSTICVRGYTRTVRPPFEISNQLKHQVMHLYRSTGSIHAYELDHLIPLELGGCPTCLANLWPQPWASPGAHEKDDVELYLNIRVCRHSMTLAEAQRLISTDWYSIYQSTVNR